LILALRDVRHSPGVAARHTRTNGTLLAPCPVDLTIMERDCNKLTGIAP
jgi:hypothetical protein